MEKRLSSTETCGCADLSHGNRRIVLTGGPGAGKTAVLELIKKNFCRHVTVLPEAASIIFGGGFWRKPSLPARKAAQRAIFHIQRELERLVEDEQESAIALCDRGTLDGLAYWPESEEGFWAELGARREEELKRYRAVIHLRSPSAARGYNHSNPMRIETALEAGRIDALIARAWDGHPRRFFVESADDFVEKALKAVALVRAELPDCCKTHRVDGERAGPAAKRAS